MTDFFGPMLAEIARIKKSMNDMMPGFGWARVKTVSPLIIETEIRKTELPASTLTVLAVNDRVFFVRYQARIVVLGKPV